MGVYNLNSVYFGSQVPIRPLNQSNEGFSSNPINANESASNATGGISKGYSAASRALALGQITAENSLKSDTTLDEYISGLIKQGKIPNKNFIIEKFDNSTAITEVNSKGQRTKEVAFNKENLFKSIGYINPETEQLYKAVTIRSEGRKLVELNNPSTGEPIREELYNSDGSLMNRYTYKKLENSEKKDENVKNGYDTKIDGVDYRVICENFESDKK